MGNNNNFYEELKKYFETTPKEKVLEDWEKSKHLDGIGSTVEEFLTYPKINLKSIEEKVDNLLALDEELIIDPPNEKLLEAANKYTLIKSILKTLPATQKEVEDLVDRKIITFIGNEWIDEYEWNETELRLLPISELRLIFDKTEDNAIPYCSVCRGCGEEGCCSPLGCKQSPDGDYCETYLQDLKFGYMMYEKLMELVGDDEKYKEQIDKIYDETYDKAYDVNK